jgi:enediyne biosynthesis protein E4
VSQPFDRMAICPAPVKPDERLKDWWVENPWHIAAKGKSLSGYERNRVYLNSGGREFFEISGLTGGADSDGDGRSVVAADFNGDGMEDLIVRQAGGGSLLVFENRMPKANWLKVSLRGEKSNRLGLGARLVAEAGGRKIVRELYPYNGFKAQGPSHVHFGLAQAGRVDKLTVTWPGGLVQEFKDVAANRHVIVEEGRAGLAAFGAAK